MWCHTQKAVTLMLVLDYVMSHPEGYNIHPHINLRSHKRNITVRYIFSNLELGRRKKFHKYVMCVNFKVECHINIPSDLIQCCRAVMTVCVTDSVWVIDSERVTDSVWVTDTHSFFVLCPLCTLNNNMTFQKLSLLLSSVQKHITWWTPQTEPASVTGHHRHTHCVQIWAWEQINS
jgi:hypothetical protein